MHKAIASGALGIDSGLIQATQSSDIHQALLQMCQQARNVVRICSASLQPAVYDHADVRAALSSLARQSRYTEVRILVSNCQAVVERGHRLLALSRQLSTAVPMRELELAGQEAQAEFVLVDSGGVIEMPASGKDPATIYFYNRVRNKTLMETFDQLWHKSPTPVALRSLTV